MTPETKYTIISADPVLGQIMVRYYSDSWPQGAIIPIDVPVTDGAFLQGDALRTEILSRAPLWHLERTHAVKQAAGFDTIAAQVIQDPPPPVEAQPITDLASF